MPRRIIITDNEADFGPAPQAQALRQPTFEEVARRDPRHFAVGATNKDTSFLSGPLLPALGGLAAMPFTGGMSAPAAIGFAGLMGGGGEAARQIAARAAGDRAPETSGEAAKEIGLAGGLMALGEGGGQGLKLAAKGVKSVGAPVMRALTGVPEKYGKAVFETPAILRRALSRGDAAKAYEAFERYTGLKGLGRVMEEEGKIFSPGELIDKTLSAAKRLKAGETVSPQELYEASQAVNHLKLSAKFGEPQAKTALESGILQRAKDRINGALEIVYPEYKTLRTQNFESKAAEQFRSFLPQNKNLSPNVLRTWAALTAAGGGLAAGSPAGLAAIPAVSPRAWGAGIKAASLASGAARAARPGVPVTAAALLDKLRSWRKPGAQE